MNPNFKYYSENSEKLNQQYNSVTFENVHSQWMEYWPKATNENKVIHVLDVGAGTGRDAAWYASAGCKVTAVEPVKEMLEHGCLNTEGLDVDWVCSSLPDLNGVPKSAGGYNFVVLSAVWMHLNKSERRCSLKVISELLTEGGLLIVSLRHGGFDDGRVSYDLSVEELEELCSEVGLIAKVSTSAEDRLGRGGVFWETVVIEKAGSVQKAF
ncbi:bifunctional 2-polyprenyl-6-hydroxyphenol methylase/3-demethylubiquinol 3-O-methyltransferase UbiG [Vibrio sp. D431a]|uniref:class I SAM-dependent methyltransferase n=1 Tax=Vibrio sp. D431a TaxID=2837388 RepID=UPI002552AC70|nr:class I SAM-dependent methyltransferase [Vibrio sp. D431a]MDK9790001.1 class I SAM-dependent methyltransferase [Vibrio sp. D431a]